MDLPVGTVAIVGADGTEGREELRALLDAEQARRKMAERRYAEALLPPAERPRWASGRVVPDVSPRIFD